MATIFSRIAAGEIPSYKIAGDDRFYAFLDIHPLTIGHTLVIPRREVDYYFDLTDEELGAINIFAGKVAAAIKKVIDCERVGVIVMGLEVPHAHIHLIPFRKMSELNFANPKLELTKEKFEETALKIRQAFAIS